MAKASDNQFPKVIITEGTTPSNPTAGDQKVFIDSADHHLKRVNSAGSVTDLEASGSGDVVGPGSSTDNAITRFDSTTGKLVQNSSATIDDSGTVNIPTGQTYNINGASVVDDTAYDATTWNGDTTRAPSKNAVRDKIESMSSGGRTLITSSSPSGTNTVSFTSIPGTYTHLIVEYVARSTRAAQTNDPMKFNLNNDTTDANYRRIQHYAYGNTTAAGDGADDRYLTNIPAASSPANSASVGFIRIPFYASTTFNKQMTAQISERRDSGATINELIMNYGREWESTAAITRLDFILDNGNFVAGSQFNLYGES